jgi:hypothetical protein
MDSERVRPALAATGDSRVDAAVEALSSLGDADLAERPAILEAVHEQLREILGELPGEPGRPGEQRALGQPGAQGAFPPGGRRPQPGPARPAVPGPGSWPRRPSA